jgi:hypothetical protein
MIIVADHPLNRIRRISGYPTHALPPQTRIATAITWLVLATSGLPQVASVRSVSLLRGNRHQIDGAVVGPTEGNDPITWEELGLSSPSELEDIQPPENLLTDGLCRGVIALIVVLVSAWIMGKWGKHGGIILIPLLLIPSFAYLHLCAAIMQVITGKYVSFAGFEKTYNSWKSWQKFLVTILLLMGVVVFCVVAFS